MSTVLKINGTTIPDSVITNKPKGTEKITFNNKNLIASNLSLMIDNSDELTYDDREASGLFYDNWYGDTVTIYDDDLNRFIWQGTVDEISLNEGTNKITVNSSNIIKQLNKLSCNYSVGAHAPARIIYEILTDLDNGALSTELIAENGFTYAQAYQEANNMTVDMTYYREDKKSILLVANELCRISQCYMFIKNDKIHLYQWEEYDGEVGIQIDERALIVNSYSHSYDTNNIYNRYSVVYDNASTSAITSDVLLSSDSSTQKTFAIPNEEIGEAGTEPSVSYKIIYDNLTGADFAGNLALSRWGYRKRIGSFSVGIEWAFLELNDLIALNFGKYYNEPARIMEKNVDEKSGVVKLKVDFLNTPHEYYDRDETAPDTPTLIDLIPLPDGTVLLKWSISAAVDYSGTLVYFSAGQGGEWYSEQSNNGVSPFREINPSSTATFYYTIVRGLEENVKYYFKIKDYDTSYNESSFSNIESVRTFITDTDLLNMYRCTGTIYTGITLDNANSESGTALTDWNILDTFKYDAETYSPAAVYESYEYENLDGFSSISWIGTGDANDIRFQYRSYSGGAWGSWSSEVDAVGTKTVNISGTNLQFRWIFYSEAWTDSDSFYLTDLD